MSPDLLELPWPAYRRLLVGQPIPASYFDKPPAKLAPLIVEIVKQESPIHIEVIMERLAELAGLPKRDRRLGRVAMGAAYHASRDGLLNERQDYWLSPAKPAQARDHRLAAGLAGQQGYICDLEILDGVRKVIDSCPARTKGEWMEITSRSFGFNELAPDFRRAIAMQIEAVIG